MDGAPSESSAGGEKATPGNDDPVDWRTSDPRTAVHPRRAAAFRRVKTASIVRGAAGERRR